jgi:Flp pilus assembly protein protease CpaA
MGDLKLATAVGAFLGPVLGAVAMLLSMIIGGLVALGWLMREWGMFGHGRISSLIGRLYFFRKKTSPNPDEDASSATIPYGVALAIGTLLTLVVCQWTGSESWFLCSVIGAAAQ